MNPPTGSGNSGNNLIPTQLALFDQVSDAVVATDCHGTIIYWNRGAERLNGYRAEEIIGKHISLTMPPDEFARISVDTQPEYPTNDRIQEFDIVTVTKSGARIPTNIRINLLRSADSKPIGVLGMAIDLTDSRRTQEDLLTKERLLREATVRELHHRVKNSLQGVVGLLRMQTAKYPDLAVPASAAISQLLATAVGFGLLERTGGRGANLADMLREIVFNVIQVTDRRVELTVEASMVRPPVIIERGHAINLGLVINELLINAIKHGVSSGNEPAALVTATRIDDNVKMQVLTSGGHLPEGFSFVDGQGLGTGLNLVRLLLPADYSVLSFADTATGVQAILDLDLVRMGPVPAA